jgi:hypothetical protein
MRRTVTTAILTGALAAIPLMGFAATHQAGAQKKSAEKHVSAASAATHATTGVVKSIDATSLVVTRSGKAGDLTFVLSPSTQREGSVGVGSSVEVRYRAEGKTLIATAVTAHQPKQQPAAPKSPKGR